MGAGLYHQLKLLIYSLLLLSGLMSQQAAWAQHLAPLPLQGSGNSIPRGLTNINTAISGSPAPGVYEQLFFYGADGGNGHEPRSTRNVSLGYLNGRNITAPININSAPFLSSGSLGNTKVAYFAEYLNNTAYVLAETPIGLYQLIRTTTGLASNPRIVGVVASNPKFLTRAGNNLFFVAGEGSPNFDEELWVCSGAVGSETVQEALDINPSGSSIPQELTSVEISGVAHLFFTAINTSSNRELWARNLTTNATIMVSEINPSLSVGSSPANLIAYNNFCYFSADDGSGMGLWRSNGTTNTKITLPAGTTVDNTVRFAVANSLLFFVATNASNGKELWKFDGTTASVIDVLSGSSSSNPKNLTPVGTFVYFSADANGSGDVELFRSNGVGSQLAGSNLYGTFGATPIHLANVNGTLYYAAWADPNVAASVYWLYRHDPTTNTTTVYWNNSNLGFSISNFGLQITEVNNDFYFCAGSPATPSNALVYYAQFDNSVVLPCAYTSVNLSYPTGLCAGSGTANATLAFNPAPNPSNLCPSGNCFSSTAGLSINATTGVIDLAASTAGTYTVTYNYVTASPNCNLSTTASVTISAGVSATIEVNTRAGLGTQGNFNSTLPNSTFNFGLINIAPAGNILNDANISLAVSPDGNKIYIADELNHCIRVADISGNNITTLAGNAGNSGDIDGVGTTARFRNPTGIATDIFGVIYVADKGNHLIRKIDPNTLQVTTIAGVVTPAGGDADNANPLFAEFSQPSDLVITPDGIIYVSDKNNHKIKRIATNGAVTTFVGPLATEATKQGYVDGAGNTARFNYPSGLDIDASGNIYVADMLNHRIRRITSAGLVSTFAGGGVSGPKTKEDVNGTLLNARFFYPVDVALATTGELYIADRSNHKIKVIKGTNVEDYAGTGANGFANGFASVAQFNYPAGLVADVFNNVYIVDKNNQRIRRIFINNPAGNISGGTTVCGTGNSGSLTVSGFSGTVANWESSTNSGQTWSTIAGTNGQTTINYSNVAQTTIYRALINLGSCGQVPSNTAAILVSTPQAPTASATPVCGTNPATNVAVTITAQGAFDGDYRWYTATNTLIPGQTNSTLLVNISATTTYKVSIRKNNCESTLTTVVATINPAPNPTITGSVNACQSSTSTYSVTNVAGNTYTWAVTGGTIQSGQNTNSINVLWGTGVSGTVQVTETNPTTCATTRSQNITLNVLPNPVISGNNTVCVSTTNQVYSTPVVANNTYLWSVPAGGTIVGSATGSSVNVQWSSAGARQVNVTQTTSSGCSRQVSYAVTVNPLPTPSITGGNSVCRNSTQAYSVTNVSGNTYNWVVTNGTIQSGQGTNAISVLWGNTANGTVQVTETITATTCSQVATLNVTLNAAPAPTITGPATTCTSTTVNRTYSVAAAAGNTFAWTVSSGGTIQSGQGTNSITVRWTTAGNENVSLTQTNASGCATTLNYAVLVNQSPAPSITGNNSVCRSSSQTYSVVNNAGNTYNWTVSGGTISAGQGTNQISVNWGTGSAGTVNVTETSPATCATLTSLNITLNPLPTPVITGTNVPCASSQQIYSVVNNAGNTYNWVVTGGTISAGQGTNQITVDWGTAGAGNVQATETTTVGCAAIANRAITIRPLPNPIITGNTTVCVSPNNQTYSVTAVSGNAYSWSVTNGTIVGSSTNATVNVQWTNAGTGRVSITQTINLTGCNAQTFVDVNINPLPTPSITGNNTVCANSTGQTYSVASSGNNFNWVVTGGSITAGQGTNQITVTWGASGVGNVQVTETISGTGCNATVNQAVSINTVPNPTIIGLSSVCENASQIYSVTNTGNQFNWIVTGGTITAGQNTNQITVTWGASGVGNVQLTETIGGTGCNRTINQAITINAIPTPSISGNSTVCANAIGQTYSVASSGNNFNWVVTGGSITAGQGTNQITVTWGASVTGNVQVTETIGGTGCNTTVNQAITINPLPTPSIAGLNQVCENASQVYSVANSGNNFNWVVTGGTITAGQGSSQITVIWGASGTGNVQVTETIGGTGCNSAVNQGVTINPVPAPGITGTNIVCENASQTYSVASSGNNFNWVVTGGTITAGQGTRQITVTWGASGAGNVQVTETIGATGCNTTVNQAITINPIPNPIVSGNFVVCANVTGQTYSVSNSSNTFNWVISGGTITAGQGTNQITVDWGASGAGNVQVTETITSTNCNKVVNQAITINPIPTPVITGSNTTCAH